MNPNPKPIHINAQDCILLDGLFQPVFFAYRIPSLLVGSSEDQIQYVQVMMDIKTGIILKESAPKELHPVIEHHNLNVE